MLYVVNTKPERYQNHEVHVAGCKWFPKHFERLGDFSHCRPAVQEAWRRGYRDADGCKFCSEACHVR
jgi:hypothetical protein